MSDAYSKAGGGMDAVVDAANVVNPLYHALGSAVEVYDAAERSWRQGDRGRRARKGGRHRREKRTPGLRALSIEIVTVPQTTTRSWRDFPPVPSRTFAFHTVRRRPCLTK